MPNYFQISNQINFRLCVHPDHISHPTNNKPTPNSTKALRSIKFFPLKTSTKTIHDFFKIDQISTRANKIAKKYANSRQAHPQLREDYALFAATRTAPETSKFKTIFDKLPEYY